MYLNFAGRFLCRSKPCGFADVTLVYTVDPMPASYSRGPRSLATPIHVCHCLWPSSDVEGRSAGRCELQGLKDGPSFPLQREAADLRSEWILSRRKRAVLSARMGLRVVPSIPWPPENAHLNCPDFASFPP